MLNKLIAIVISLSYLLTSSQTLQNECYDGFCLSAVGVSHSGKVDVYASPTLSKSTSTIQEVWAESKIEDNEDKTSWQPNVSNDFASFFYALPVYFIHFRISSLYSEAHPYNIPIHLLFRNLRN